MADNLKRIADALDGGDPKEGTPSEEGNLKRIADYIVENGMGGGGGGGSPLLIHATYDESEQTTTLDKTWREIKDAYLSVGCIVDNSQYNDYWKKWDYSYKPLKSVDSSDENSYYVRTFDGMDFRTTSEDGYPLFRDN